LIVIVHQQTSFIPALNGYAKQVSIIEKTSEYVTLFGELDFNDLGLSAVTSVAPTIYAAATWTAKGYLKDISDEIDDWYTPLSLIINEGTIDNPGTFSYSYGNLSNNGYEYRILKSNTLARTRYSETNLPKDDNSGWIPLTGSVTRFSFW
jgi:hypothetical protein